MTNDRNQRNTMTEQVKALLDYDLTHKHSGNGYVIVEDVGDEMVRVAYYSGHKNEVNSQAFLAWIKMLTITKRDILENPKDPKSKVIGIEDVRHECAAVEELRRDIASGKKRVVQTHIREAA